MYQEYFNFVSLPFSLTPNPNFYCQLVGHQEALNILEFCIKSGEGFIKITGEVGTGKTLLCRKLLDRLNNEYISAYIPNPDLSPLEIRIALARELGLNVTHAIDVPELTHAIYERLFAYHASGKKVVLIIDEAQALSDAALETVRLFTNLETESHKLLQIVLFGQPELNQRLNAPHLRQLKQRISFSYTLPVLSRHELDIYLGHRLAVAGFTHSQLFTKKARDLLFKASQGIPRLVNILSHKSLLVAYGRGLKHIDHKAVRLAISDTESVTKSTRKWLLFVLAGMSIVFCFLLAALLF